MKKTFSILLLLAAFSAAQAQNRFDLNQDGSVNVGDVTTLVNVILGKQPGLDPSDVTDGSLVAVEQMSDGNYTDGLFFYSITSTITHEVKVAGARDQSLEDAAIPEAVGINHVKFEVTSVGAGAFEDYDNLKTVILPKTIKSIGDKAFYSCSTLTSINIPSSVTRIGTDAFAYNSLQRVEIPNLVAWFNITFTNEYSNPLFYAQHLYLNGEEVTSLEIPNSVSKINDYVFYGCSGLTGSLSIPNSVTSIGSSAFCGCSGLTGSLSIPNSVTTIGSDAFHGCSNLKNVNIPKSVTYIGQNAFNACYSLKGPIIIPDGISYIDGGTFAFCRSLTSITIPSTVKEISDISRYEGTAYYESIGAFQGCESLNDIYILHTNPNNIKMLNETYKSYGKTYYQPFDGVPLTATLHVPAGCAEAFKTTKPWSNFVTIIDDADH